MWFSGTPHRTTRVRERNSKSEQGAAPSATQMRVSPLLGDGAASGAGNEPLLQQIRLVNFTDRVGLFTDCRGETLDSHRAAIKLVDDRGEDRAVHAIESARVYLEQLECTQGDLASDD